MRVNTFKKYQISFHTHSSIFQCCDACGKAWKTKQEFLKDRQIALSNYSVQTVDELSENSGGVLVFVHKKRACGKFLKISASDFRDRLRGPSFLKIR